MQDDSPVPRPELGKIQVSSAAVAALAASVVMDSYGVVGVAYSRLRNGLVEMLRDGHQRGIEVRFEGDAVIVDAYVILEYGLRISEVANNIMQSVSFAIKRTLGFNNVIVNINVCDLRVSNVD